LIERRQFLLSLTPKLQVLMSCLLRNFPFLARRYIKLSRTVIWHPTNKFYHNILTNFTKNFSNQFSTSKPKRIFSKSRNKLKFCTNSLSYKIWNIVMKLAFFTSKSQRMKARNQLLKFTRRAQLKRQAVKFCCD